MPKHRTIYLDSSVYGMITSNGDSQDVRSMLDNMNVQVTVSGTNLQESSRAPKSVRFDRYSTLASVGHSYERHTVQYLLSQELLAEIKIHRPDWINPNPDLRMISYYLSDNRNRWKWIQTHPDSDPAGLRDNDREIYDLAGKMKNTQKEIQQILDDDSPTFEVSGTQHSRQHLESEASLAMQWRIENALSWFNSLSAEEQNDSKDFLLPYLVMDRIPKEEFVFLWSNLVVRDRVPRNYIQARVLWLQESRKITAGNLLDQLHACRMLNHDMFLTTDRVLFEILVELETDLRGWPRRSRRAISPMAQPIFLERSNSSSTDEISAAILK
jgi:hypothetical protein